MKNFIKTYFAESIPFIGIIIASVIILSAFALGAQTTIGPEKGTVFQVIPYELTTHDGQMDLLVLVDCTGFTDIQAQKFAQNLGTKLSGEGFGKVHVLFWNNKNFPLFELML